MSEISEIEIKSMTKEQNYMCGYENGKSDVLEKIRTEIDEQYDRVHPYDILCAEGLEMALNIIDKYKAENDGCNNYELIKKIDIVHCSECMYFNNDYCKQYEMPADEQDGCSNYELIRGYDDGK